MRFALSGAVCWAALLLTVPLRAADDGLLPVAAIERDTPVDFETEILPILRRNCIACHNATEAESSLVLETAAAILQGGDSGPAAVAGQGAKSLLLERARGVDSIMPPEDNKVGAKPLTPEELGLLRLWIDQGARGDVSRKAAQVQWQPLPPGINPIYALAVSPDGQYAACSRANQVFIYHLRTGRLVERLTDPALLQTGIYKQPGVADLDLVQSLAFSSDGMWLASGGYRTARLWRRTDRQTPESWPAAKAEHPLLAVDGEGRWLASATAEGKIQLVDLSSGKPAALLEGHAGDVCGLGFLADGKQLFSAGTDQTVRLWDVADGKSAAVARLGAEFASAALLGDGQHMVTGSADGKLRTWPLDRLQAELAEEPLSPVREIATDGKPIVLIAAARQSTHVATASSEAVITVVDAASGKKVRDWKAPGGVAALVLLPAGDRLIVAGADKKLRQWTVADGKLAAEAAIAPQAIFELAERERRLNVARSIVAAEKAAVETAEKSAASEAESLKKAAEAKQAADKELASRQAAAKKADDQQQAAADAEAAARKTLDKTQQEVAQAQQQLEAAQTAVKQAEGELKSAEDKPPAEQALADARRRADQAKKDLTDRQKAAEEAAKADKAATDKRAAAKKAAEEAGAAREAAQRTAINAERTLGSAEAGVKRATDAIPLANQALADAEKAVEQATADRAAAAAALESSATAARGLALSPDGLLLACAGDQGICTFRAADLAPCEQFSAAEAEWSAVAMTDDRLLAAGGGTVHAWTLLPGFSLVRTIGSPQSDELADRVTALDFSPDGRLLATGSGAPSRSGELKLWHVADGSLHAELIDAHTDTVLGVRFSPDGSQLASCSADKFVRVFAVADGQLVRAFEGHTHHVLGVAWQADGRSLASAGADQVVKVWDLASGEQRRTLTGFGKEVTAIAYVAESDTLATACGDKLVRLHQTSDGRALRSLSGATDFLFSLALPADGKSILAGGYDSVLRIWNTADGKLLTALEP